MRFNETSGKAASGLIPATDPGINGARSVSRQERARRKRCWAPGRRSNAHEVFGAPQREGQTGRERANNAGVLVPSERSNCLKRTRVMLARHQSTYANHR